MTAVQFAPSGQAVVSASLDGTVRAFDLNRYKNFRVLTTPEPTQFLSLALDPSGQVVCAGSMDPFNVYVWSLQTGRLTDVLSGHSGPVTSLSFSPSSAAEPILASASWDHTVRLWNLFASKKSFIEPLAHATDVLAVAFRPDGKQLAPLRSTERSTFGTSRKASRLARLTESGTLPAVARKATTSRRRTISCPSTLPASATQLMARFCLLVDAPSSCASTLLARRFCSRSSRSRTTCHSMAFWTSSTAGTSRRAE